MPSIIYGKYGAISGSSVYGEGEPTGEAGGGGAPDYGTPQSSIDITQTVDSILFTWTVNGYDSALQEGTFYDGSPWVAPASPGGAVRLTALTPDSYDPVSASFSNPQVPGIQRNITTTGLGSSSQGLLPTGEGDNHHQALDIRNQFPIVMIAGSEGVVSLTGANFLNEDRNGTNDGQAINCYCVLTILDAPPSGSVSNEYFRPSPYGGDKTTYTSEEFDFTTLPSETDVDSSVNTTAYSTIVTWWEQAWAGENTASYALSGEIGRAYLPDVGPTNGYSADLALSLHDHILSCFGTDALTTTKKDAVYALLQAGIDIYGAWKSGFEWGPGGAGQYLARRARISFFGALIISTTIKDEIAGIRSNAATGRIPFQEDGQVHKDPAAGNVAIWGDIYEGGGGQQAIHQDKDIYWDMCIGGNAFDGAIGDPIDLVSNARNVGDPYHYIDGPAQEPGTSYMQCCATALMQSYVLIMRMWPEFATAAGNTVLPEFIDRVVDDHGIWTQGDICAPPDPRDAINLENSLPYEYYGVTWGDDGAGNCITNAEATAAGHPNTPTTGRHSNLDGNPISFFRESDLMVELWTDHGATP